MRIAMQPIGVIQKVSAPYSDAGKLIRRVILLETILNAGGGLVVAWMKDAIMHMTVIRWHVMFPRGPAHNWGL